MNAKSPSIDLNKRGTLTEDAGLSTAPVPLEPYRSASFYEQERDRVFKRAWLLMARVEELPEAGSYVVKDIPPCKISVLITRSKNDKIQAFYNTCSHRGSKVTTENQGKKARFVCPYHQWTYSNEGDLIGIPDQANFFDVDKKKCGLTPIATDTWEGWIFINLQPQPEVTLDRFLGPMKEYMANFKYPGADNPVVFKAKLDANWKVVSDAFIETYHIPCIHPQTIGTTFSSKLNPHARLLDARTLGPHQAVSMFGNADYILDPKNKAEMLGHSGGEAGSVIAAANKEKAAEFLAHPAINPTSATHWSMDVNLIFPHIHIDCGPGGFWTHYFWPLSPNTSLYEGRFYMEPAATMRGRFLQEMYISRVADVILEDLVNVARTQEGIDTGGKQFMQLQDSEFGIRHSTTQIIKWVESDTVEEALS
jgi:phenylpropionate dioxygenase-like ring-hydroxylating dioxygenase large terminal subunit